MNNTEFVEDGKIFYRTDDICPDCGEYLLRTWGADKWEYTCNRTGCDFGY